MDGQSGNENFDDQPPRQFELNRPLPVILFALLLVFSLFVVWQARWFAAATTVETPRNEVEAAGTLVEDFPDMPVYEGARLMRSNRKSADDSDAFEAEWQTAASVRLVTDWYLSELDKAQWIITEQPEETSSSEQFISAINEDDTLVHFSVESENGHTTITAEVPF